MNTMGSPAATTFAVCHRRAEERALASPRPPPYWSVAYLYGTVRHTQQQQVAHASMNGCMWYLLDLLAERIPKPAAVGHKRK